MEYLGIVIKIIIAMILTFFIDAGVVWLICWALKAIGITAICGWTVAFSWPLVILVILICDILGSIFKINIMNN